MIANVNTHFQHHTDHHNNATNASLGGTFYSGFMPNGSKVNFSTNDTCEWNPEKTNYFAIFAILLIVAGFVGNMLVCLAIWTERRLQTPTNYFLLSLAVADLLVSVLVMPLGIIVEIAGKSIYKFYRQESDYHIYVDTR